MISVYYVEYRFVNFVISQRLFTSLVSVLVGCRRQQWVDRVRLGIIRNSSMRHVHTPSSTRPLMFALIYLCLICVWLFLWRQSTLPSWERDPYYFSSKNKMQLFPGRGSGKQSLWDISINQWWYEPPQKTYLLRMTMWCHDFRLYRNIWMSSNLDMCCHVPGQWHWSVVRGFEDVASSPRRKYMVRKMLYWGSNLVLSFHRWYNERPPSQPLRSRRQGGGEAEDEVFTITK